MSKNVLRAILVLVAAVSCTREPIYEKVTDYFLLPQISYRSDYDTPGKPELLTALFYDPVSHEKVSQQYMPPEGGYLYGLQPGEYEMLVFNLGTVSTLLTGVDSFSTAKAYTSTISQTAGMRVVGEPDHLLVGRSARVLLPVMTEMDTTFVIETPMETILDTWCLMVDGIRGLRNAANISIYVSGQSSSNRLSTLERSDDEVTIYFPGQVSDDYRLIWTPFRTFGKLAGRISTLRLEIEVVGVTGESYKFSEDVTGQFNDPANTAHLIAVNFDIEIPGRQEGGFVPDVDEWDDEVTDIDIM